MSTLNINHRKKATKGRGFTLIELMVGIALGIFLVGGVISIFTSNQQNFAINDNLAKLQESSRFAYEQMNREVRDAGTNPCGVRAVNSVISSSTPPATRSIPWWGDWDAGTLRGYDGDEEVEGAGVTFGTSVNNRVTGTDALVVMRTVNNDSLLRSVSVHSTSTNQITLANSSNFQKQDLMFMCDNASGAIFEITLPNSAPSTVLSFDTSAPSSNCSTSLGWKSGANCNTNSVVKSFTAGSIITKFDPAIWYVGNTSDGGRALYRETMHKTTSPDKIVTERREYVPDVHDMQITYLMRTNPLATDTAAASVLDSTWTTASTVNAKTGKWSAANVDRKEAVAVRIELTFKSKETLGIDGNSSKAIERKTIAVISLRNREISR
jgi:type IV pilus assembly protein PilW